MHTFDKYRQTANFDVESFDNGSSLRWCSVVGNLELSESPRWCLIVYELLGVVVNIQSRLAGDDVRDSDRYRKKQLRVSEKITQDISELTVNCCNCLTPETEAILQLMTIVFVICCVFSDCHRAHDCDRGINGLSNLVYFYKMRIVRFNGIIMKCQT